MEAVKSKLCYYFPFLESLRTPLVVQELNHLFNAVHRGLPSELNRINVIGDVAVLEWDKHPNYVIKVEVPTTVKTFTYYYTRKNRFPVEEDSLQLRVKMSYQMRKIIWEENLDRLYVPKKWTFSYGVVAEKLDILSWDETDRKIKAMTSDGQRALITQIWKLIYLTGNQDLPRNFRIMRNGQVAFYDTEPYGMTLKKIEELRPQATANFLRETFFDYRLKLEVIQDFFR